jgi:hypothetical protein
MAPTQTEAKRGSGTTLCTIARLHLKKLSSQCVALVRSNQDRHIQRRALHTLHHETTSSIKLYGEILEDNSTLQHHLDILPILPLIIDPVPSLTEYDII